MSTSAFPVNFERGLNQAKRIVFLQESDPTLETVNKTMKRPTLSGRFNRFDRDIQYCLDAPKLSSRSYSSRMIPRSMINLLEALNLPLRVNIAWSFLQALLILMLIIMYTEIFLNSHDLSPRSFSSATVNLVQTESFKV